MKDLKYEALGFRLKASGNISTIALIWLFSALISYIMRLTNTQSSLISAALFFANIATYVLTFLAFKTENQAEALEYEKKNGLLKTFTVLVIPFFVLILLASFSEMFFSAFIKEMINLETDETVIADGYLFVGKISYLSGLVSNIFHNMNLIGLWVVKIYLDENRDKRQRTFSLVTAIAIGLHLLCAIVKYLILYSSADNTGSGLFNTLTSISVYASYFAVFLLFESRRLGLKKDMAELRNSQQGTGNISY